LKSCRTNALNVRLSADHVCFTLGGRHWRRVIGASAADPERTFVGLRGSEGVCTEIP